MAPLLASVVAAPHELQLGFLLTLVVVGTFWVVIGSILRFIGTALWVSLKFLVSKIAIALRFVYIALQAVARAILSALVAVYNALHVFLTQMIPAAFRTLATWLGNAAAFLQHVFGPILAAINRVLSVVDWLWRHVVRPLLAVMDALESFLRLLERLGVTWAGKLADSLSKIRAELVRAFAAVRREVNEIKDVLGLLLDPRGWISRSPYVWSFYAFAADVFNVVGLFGKTNARLPIISASAALQLRKALREWPPGAPPRDEGTKRALDEWDAMRRAR